ncbi:MAG: type II toxin-antitoxin system death-on-curing family toxin [Rhodospirillaceae bacterium]|nr:type II toxin-antitoxin system death-on-curing family toxin [Rhodospirillaceae bacterium]
MTTLAKDWRWLNTALVFAIHDRQIADHGGVPGVKDEAAVESAIARPINKAAYNSPDAAELAAAYAFGLVRNHGFNDGNKRTAWVAARVFLADNGYKISFQPFDAIKTVEDLAAGKIDEEAMAEWFRGRLR